MNSKEILTSLEGVLDTMKKEKDEQYDAFYCYYMCIRADFLSEEMADIFSKESLKEGWLLRDYFMKTSLKNVYVYDSQLPKELGNDLVEHFSVGKARLHIDLASYVEEELAGMRDGYLNKMTPVKHFDSYQDEDISFEDKSLVNQAKGSAYSRILLEKYFTNKSGKGSLKTFVSDVLYYGSFYVALKKTQVRIVQKTVISYYDEFCLYQLIERYITFSPEYRDDYKSTLNEVFEYGLTQLRTDIVGERYSKKNTLEIIGYIAGGLITKYQSPFYDADDCHYFEFGAICLSVFHFTKKTCDFSYFLKDLKLKKDRNTKKCMQGLFNIIIFNKPFLIEEGFYGRYEGRFTLDEFRLRTQMNEEADELDFDAARITLKKIKKHKDFFRYIFHEKMIDINELEDLIEIMLDREKKSKAREYFQEFRALINELREFVVNEYPTDQIKNVLLILLKLDYTVGELNQKLHNIPFDEELFQKEYESKVEELLGIPKGKVKIGRNDSCICGSGKKLKKCCGKNS